LHRFAPTTRELKRRSTPKRFTIGNPTGSAIPEICDRRIPDWTNYHVQIPKTTALVDTDTKAVLDMQCSTGKPHDTKIGWQVARRSAGDLTSLTAADKGYDWKQLREKLRRDDVRPLSKHLIFQPIDHAYNARVGGPHHR
jgi:IS5 family transposase